MSSFFIKSTFVTLSNTMFYSRQNFLFMRFGTPLLFFCRNFPYLFIFRVISVSSKVSTKEERRTVSDTPVVYIVVCPSLS